MKNPLDFFKNQLYIESKGVYFPTTTELNTERLLTYGIDLSALNGQNILDKVPMSAAFQAIEIITNALVQMPISVVDRNGNPRPQHPFNRLFAEPNNIMNKSQTFKRMYEDFVGNGNGFGVLNVSGPRADTVTEIVPAKLKSASFDRHSATPTAIYELRKIGEEDAAEYTRSDIIHFAGSYYNGSDLLAISPLEVINELLNNIRKSQKLFMKSLERVTSSVDFFEVDRSILQGTSGDQANKLYQKIEEAIRAARQDGYVALPAGVKLSTGSPQSIIDQTIMSYLTHAVEEIARVFNIGARYLGVTRNVRVANELSTQAEDLLKITLAPRVLVIEEELTRILPAADKRNGLKVKLDTTEASKGSFMDRVKAAKEAYTSGLATRGEARDYIGYRTDEEFDTFIHAVPGAAPGSEEGPNDDSEAEETEEDNS